MQLASITAGAMAHYLTEPGTGRLDEFCRYLEDDLLPHADAQMVRRMIADMHDVLAPACPEPIQAGS
jgi:hypothetical protein